MNNNTRIIDRVFQIIEYKNISVNKFSKIIGVSNSYFGKIKEKGGISANIIESILREYEEISPEWLLLGEGEMLKGNSNTLENPDSSALINEKERIISMLEAQIKMLQAQIEIKDGQIKELLKQRAADGAKDTTSAMAG